MCACVCVCLYQPCYSSERQCNFLSAELATGPKETRINELAVACHLQQHLVLTTLAAPVSLFPLHDLLSKDHLNPKFKSKASAPMIAAYCLLMTRPPPKSH